MTVFHPGRKPGESLHEWHERVQWEFAVACATLPLGDMIDKLRGAVDHTFDAIRTQAD